ncbi:hypothetical protein TU94_29010 [Streptomyces cyaneogriseus subsp. noncyanogenus]|uniref:Uncharacterized protein n=1 Tax=Streptomyces cyaneogriseus subsp. noncyanogenus TaxID=477245 RepID=A0A0C5G4G8_9ACTN|nr:hypothetical protein [Streptomyces cyaneogriseus]AJP04888.1 hypothetical protein TU94_29010 [Streptomyces cyaneogriseus subsp. noncyanogenus]
MRMNKIYRDAISGALTSVDTGNRTNMTVTNGTPVHLLVYWVGLDGQLYGRNERTRRIAPGFPGQVLDPGATLTWTNVDRSYCFVAKVGYSGAFAAAWRVGKDNAAVSLTGRDLLDPDDIGETPVPTRSVIIPPNGPRVLVGAGTLPNGNFVTREQFWQRLPESYSLAAGEEKTVNYTQTQGMQETSSGTETVTASVSASASAGWGPFSASVNASLSKSSTKSQQVTVSTQTTSLASNQYTNDTSHGWMCLFWGLMDVVTVFDGTGTPLSSVVSARGPSVVWGPVDVDELVGKSSAAPALPGVNGVEPPAIAAVRKARPPGPSAGPLAGVAPIDDHPPRRRS